jgi:hypothetical protein
MDSHLGKIIRDILSDEKGLVRQARKSDKREHQRFDVRALVRITLEGNRSPGTTHLRNLSIGGVGLMCRTEIAPGTRFTIRLPYVDGNNQSSRDMCCESVRCSKAADGVFLIGAKFIATPVADSSSPLAASRPPAIDQTIPQSEVERIRAAILGADAA